MTSKLPDIPEPVTLKIRDIEKLKVIELKDALKLRGCSAKGNKPSLAMKLFLIISETFLRSHPGHH